MFAFSLTRARAGSVQTWHSDSARASYWNFQRFFQSIRWCQGRLCGWRMGTHNMTHVVCLCVSAYLWVLWRSKFACVGQTKYWNRFKRVTFVRKSLFFKKGWLEEGMHVFIRANCSYDGKCGQWIHVYLRARVFPGSCSMSLPCTQWYTVFVFFMCHAFSMYTVVHGICSFHLHPCVCMLFYDNLECSCEANMCTVQSPVPGAEIRSTCTKAYKALTAAAVLHNIIASKFVTWAWYLCKMAKVEGSA